MIEKVIEKNVITYAQNKGWLTYKFNSTACRGVPDRLCIGPTGQFLFIEFKRKGHFPTALQNIQIKKLQEHKMSVFVVDNIAQGKQIIDNYTGN